MNDWYQRMVATLQLNATGTIELAWFGATFALVERDAASFRTTGRDGIVPEQLRSFIRQNQRVSYCALFRASSDAIKKLALDQKHIGADLLGFFGVLHTWGRTLQYHPHIHYIVCGGALSSSDASWHPSRIDFFLPVKALSEIFRAKFRDLMKKAKLLGQIPADVWLIDWNVNSQAVSSSEACLKYLAPYVFKVAISNSRIVSLQDRTVLIRFSRRLIRLRRNRKPHSERSRILPLESWSSSAASYNTCCLPA